MKRAAMTGCLLAMGCATMLGGCAQYGPYGRPTETGVLNHDVQRLWDNTFYPGRDGDRAVWEHRREINRRNWCRTNPGYVRCGPYR